mmetsp:Transcript_116282/g.183871  ORF Transcript_116282/g.183871 Transcript_116282/m.183871 type:complete len:238 (-) Transcript_116282:633-1346(-)
MTTARQFLLLFELLHVAVVSLPVGITKLIRDHRRHKSVTAKLLQFREHNGTTPASIAPLDLWGIHDLLLIGHRGPVLHPDDNASHAMVEAAVENLAEMLHEIHPVPKCREAIRQETSYNAKANAAWTCLDLDRENFTGAYVSDSQVDNEVAITVPKFTDSLGACKESNLPRSCSYWASLHAMGVRADMLNKGQEFLTAIVQIISGGALYCFGCTMHFRLLNEAFLPPHVRAESVSFF